MNGGATGIVMRRRQVLAGLGGAVLSGLLPGMPVGAAPGDGVAAYRASFEAFRKELAADPDRAEVLSGVEAGALARTNFQRRREGVNAAPLKREEMLAWIARHYASAIAAGAPFDHHDREGRGPAERIALLHRRLVGASGENLFTANQFRRGNAMGAGRFAVDSLMESPGHRRNILDSRWTHCGMGAGVRGDEMVLVQLFSAHSALLARDLPMTLPPGAPLSLLADANPRPALVALVPLEEEPGLGDLANPAEATAPLRPGLYRSHLAFVESSGKTRTSYFIHPGPAVQVG